MTAAPTKASAIRRLITEGLKAAAIIGVTLLVLRQGWIPTGLPAASAAKAEKEEPAPAPEEPAAVVSLDPFVVNVTGTGSSAAYLRAALAIALKNAALAEELTADAALKARLRAGLLETLAGQTVGQVTTVEGRTALTSALRERTSSLLGDAELDILITDFVVEY
jgi:flagellar basal body-associated protein FliL